MTSSSFDDKATDTQMKASAKVLVVDDEQDIAEVISYLLVRAGCQVTTVGTGRAALDVVRNDGIGLVMLDYMLPDINGLDVLKQIKAVSPDTKVIIVTGRGTDKVLADVLEAGASAYVVKPFLNDRLVELVRETLAR